MSAKIGPSHLDRRACVYLRQSTVTQVENNRESTARQYKLVDRAVELGWPRDRVEVLDKDLGRSGSGAENRRGFDELVADVALGRVGLVLATEMSRVARNNAEWYRLLDFCAITDTLIADEEGLYHPGAYNDRLLLGLKGTLSEAELHQIRARLMGGIRNKAQRGALRLRLPIGFVWGTEEGEILLDPNEAVTGAVRTVFDKFAELGSIRQVWIWFRREQLELPSRRDLRAEIRWGPPTYPALQGILTNPVYAGAYRYGRTRQERYIDAQGRVRRRSRNLPPSEWKVFIRNHHPGFIDWETYELNKARIEKNARPRPDQHRPGGAVREGGALLQGLATCGRCGRNLRVYYHSRHSTPVYYCPGNAMQNSGSQYCMRIGGTRIDRAVADTFLETIEPAGMEAVIEAEETLEADRDAAMAQWRLQVERAQYEARKAERRYRSVEPENRLVARQLELEWEQRLAELARAKRELEERDRRVPRKLTSRQREQLRALGRDLRRVWHAETTTDRDRKELLQTLIEEVGIAVDREADQAHLLLRWRGGTITEMDVTTRTAKAPSLQTDEDTIALLRRLAPHYADAVIAGILNKQGRRTLRGERFTVMKVGKLRRGLKLGPWERPTASEGEVATVAEAAKILGVAKSTLHRCLNDGIVIGEQMTPGAPWRIRITEELRARFREEAPTGYVPIQDVMRILGVSRQTVLQRVKRGRLEAVHVRRGRRKGLRIKLLEDQMPLFEGSSGTGV